MSLFTVIFDENRACLAVQILGATLLALPLGSRVRRRLMLDYASRDERLACLAHLLESAGNPSLITTAPKRSSPRAGIHPSALETIHERGKVPRRARPSRQWFGDLQRGVE